MVSLAVSADRPAVCDMVKRLSLHESLLEDLDMFYQAHRDMVSHRHTQDILLPIELGIVHPLVYLVLI